MTFLDEEFLLIEHPVPTGFKPYKSVELVTNQVCPGCGDVGCGEVWFPRKKKSDPCYGVTCCGRAELWHDWSRRQKKGDILQHFFRKTLMGYSEEGHPCSYCLDREAWRKLEDLKQKRWNEAFQLDMLCENEDVIRKFRVFWKGSAK